MYAEDPSSDLYTNHEVDTVLPILSTDEETRLHEAPGVGNCTARSQNLLQPLLPTVTQGAAFATMAQKGARRKDQSRSTQEAKCVLTDSPRRPQCNGGEGRPHRAALGRRDRRGGHPRRGPQATLWHCPDATVKTRSRDREPGLQGPDSVAVGGLCFPEPPSPHLKKGHFTVLLTQPLWGTSGCEVWMAIHRLPPSAPGQRGTGLAPTFWGSCCWAACCCCCMTLGMAAEGSWALPSLNSLTLWR